MFNCRDIEPLFASYVDGEALPEQRASVDEHLSRCPPCRERVTEERAVHDVVAARRQGLRACASEHLRARCAAHRPSRALDEAGRTAAVTSHVAPGTSPVARGTSPVARGTSPVAPGTSHVVRRWLPLSVAATFVLAVGSLVLFSALNQTQALASQLAIDHLKCAKFQSAVQDPGAAARQWAQSNGWTIQVPASAPDRQLEFVSVRRCLVTEGRTAHMLYKWRGEPLSLYVLASPLRDDEGALRTVEAFGHDAVMWSANERTYVVLAPGKTVDTEIRPVVGYMKANAR